IDSRVRDAGVISSCYFSYLFKRDSYHLFNFLYSVILIIIEMKRSIIKKVPPNADTMIAVSAHGKTIHQLELTAVPNDTAPTTLLAVCTASASMLISYHLAHSYCHS
ncbi:MAG: hypothetical protein ACRC0J_12385, partial [Shewanella oncorhynchi]